MKNRRDDSFIRGILIGAAGMLTAALVVCVVGFAGYVFITKESSANKVSAAEQTTAAAGVAEDAAISDVVSGKLDVLQECVDKYFLFETEDDDFASNIYKGYMEALGDPYSCYYTSSEYSHMMESTNGEYVGIGVMVQKSLENGEISVVAAFEGCPGEEAGILPGDIITEVDGTNVMDTDISEVVSYIKGESGTDVSIRVYRESEQDYVDLTVTRRKIEVPTVSHEMLDGGVGYIQITQFEAVTSGQYLAAIDDLKSQGMKGLIVDVRNNPGGLLNAVVSMLDAMLPEGKIVYTEDKNGQGDTYHSDAENYFDLPLVVLANENSASAAEIFCGAIQDYGIGTIVGTTTFGKGIVQNIIPFADGTAIKLTVSRYFTPNGVCIHGAGIKPDVEVELDEALKTKSSISHEEDNQLQKAIQELNDLCTKTE